MLLMPRRMLKVLCAWPSKKTRPRADGISCFYVSLIRVQGALLPPFFILPSIVTNKWIPETPWSPREMGLALPWLLSLMLLNDA
jgi:hypothetical protein